MPLPFTQKMLVNWAGPQVFRDAMAMVDKGLVLLATIEPPFIRGTILWYTRSLRTGLKINTDGTVENLCPCRDSKERGIICVHAIALGLELIKRANNPEREAARAEERRRAERLARHTDDAYVRRAPPDTPGVIQAKLILTLAAGWRESARRGLIPILCEIEYGGQSQPIDAIPRDITFAFTRAEEAILFVLEDIAEGRIQRLLQVKTRDFINILELHAGLPLRQEEAPHTITVHASRLTSFLKVALAQDTGDLIVSIHTERPLGTPDARSLALFAGRSGWLLDSENFWPLEQMLPEPLRAVYDQPVRIPRAAALIFARDELPTLGKFMRIETDVTGDLFTVESAPVTFSLAVRGSPASIAATLYAGYEGVRLIANKADPAGRFAIPDPKDILRYTIRNLAAETAALEKLRRFGFSGETGDALSPIVGTREVLNFFGSHLPAIRRMGWKVEMEGRIRSQAEQYRSATPVVAITRPPSGGWFEIGFQFDDTTGGTINPAEVQRALRKGESFINRGDHVILLDSDAIQSMMDVFAECTAIGGESAGHFRLPAIYASFVQSSLNALDGVDVEADDRWRTTVGNLDKATSADPVVLPPALAETLRPYQKDGVQWLRHLEANIFGGILADEMGLGKTLQALTWMQLDRIHAEARGKPVLIICPTSLVANWDEEAHRFTPGLRTLMISGADRHSKWGELPAADVVITSYALLRRDLEKYLEHNFAMVVLDEAQHIKNVSTQNAICAKQLKAHHRLVLTGTPIENSVTDLWSIMDFLMPGYLGSYEHFKRHYEAPIAQGGEPGETAQVKLRRKLRPFLLRRLKTEVATDLPPRIERIATCSLTPDQRTVYLHLLENARRKLTDMVTKQGFQRSRMEVLKTLLRLRQVCCHLGLLRLPDLQSAMPSAKTDLFFELLDEAIDSGHRALVFSQFVSMLTILRGELDKRNVRYCYLDGSTIDRQSIVRQFNTDRSIPLFLISLKAGGTGLNLTGADMVIHFDPWWNPAVEDQATDRAHRIGQHRTVYSIKLITRCTVEEKVLALQKRKQSVIDATLARESSGIPKFTWNEVLELLDPGAGL